MKISVITVAFNASETIRDTIRSVVEQDHPDVEYIVIDGKSTDNTMDIVNHFREKIAVIVSEKDQGMYDAMNKGIARATGEIIGILNSDDMYADPQVLSDVALKFQETSCEGLYADLDYVDRKNTGKIIRRWKAGEYREGLFREGWMPPHPTFFVRKKWYDTLGTYNLALRSAADYELMLRFIHKHGIALAYLPRVIIHMRTGGQSNVSLKNRIRANMEDREAWKMNDLKPAWYTLSWKPVRKVWQFLR